MPSKITEEVPESGSTKLNARVGYFQSGGAPDEPIYFWRPAASAPEGQKPVNYISEDYTVQIQDVRGRESEYSLDQNGFGFSEVDTTDDAIERIRSSDHEFIKADYYKEMEEALKKYTGADQVIVFDHLVRKKDPEKEVAKFGHEKTRYGPVRLVHVDVSREYAFGFLSNTYLSEVTSGRKVSRAQVINVWRPLVDGVNDWSLAVMDHRSIAPADPIPVNANYEDSNYNRQGYLLRHNPDHKWHFLSKQNKDEAIFLKNFDSRKDVATMSPHTSFENPLATGACVPRESIEVRAWVLYYGDEAMEIETTPEWTKPNMIYTTDAPESFLKKEQSS